jgi:hypothetical protein
VFAEASIFALQQFGKEGFYSTIDTRGGACETTAMRTVGIRAVVLVVASAYGVLTGCEEALPPATTPAAGLPAIRGGEALITFVRPPSPCDTGEYAVIVDSQGRFVADVSSGTRVAVPAPAGSHVYYAWSNVNLMNARDPDFLGGVTALRVRTQPSEESFVLVDTPACQYRFLPSLHQIGNTPSWQRELKGFLDDTKPVQNDPVAGQREVDARPARLRAYLRLGHLALAKRELGAQALEVHEGQQQEDGFGE